MTRRGLLLSVIGAILALFGLRSETPPTGASSEPAWGEAQVVNGDLVVRGRIIVGPPKGTR